MSKKEILNLPQVVENWVDIKEFVLKHRAKKIEHSYPNELSETKWANKIDENLLETVWVYEELRGERHIAIAGDTNYLDCFFGSIETYRYTIKVTAYEHKYANLMYPEIADYLIRLFRLIAQKFDETEVLFCVDSCFITAEVGHEARHGLTFDELKKFAKTNFGEVPTDINEGMKNCLFLDKVDNPIPEIQEWGWNDVKWD